MGPSEHNAAEPAVAVVIIHWNQPDRCRKTVEHFRAQSIPVRIAIVDNGSAPSTAPPEIPGVTVLRQAANLGFGPAANVGLRHWLQASQCPYLVVAPHDALPAPDCLERMLHEMQSRPTAGLACADVGDGVTPYINAYLGGVGVPSSVDEGWQPADFVHGTLFLARRACLDEIGLFDERYFAYGEEVEIGMRARRARWEVGLVRGARVVNPTMRLGSDAVDYLMQRNTLLFVREMSGRAHAITRLAIALYGLGKGLVAPASRPLLFAPRGRVRGIADYLRGRYGAPPADFFEQLDGSGEPLRQGSRAMRAIGPDRDWLLRRRVGE